MVIGSTVTVSRVADQRPVDMAKPASVRQAANDYHSYAWLNKGIRERIRLS